MTPEQRAKHYADNAARRQRRRDELRASEAGRLVLCPVCDRWFASWRAQSKHEVMEHIRKAAR